MAEDILKKIKKEKEKDIPIVKETLKNISIGNAEASNRDFKEALIRGRSRNSNSMKVIAELKKASPSAGTIRKESGFTLQEILNSFNKYADAISVLTETKFFNGDPLMIKEVKELSDLPVLRKDFIIDESQILESRLLGADAILLIASLLSKEEIDSFISKAKKLEMDCLVEVHNEEELGRVLETNAEIIGINNRNLKTFEIDLNTTNELLEKIKSKVPANRLNDLIIVSESGFLSGIDVKKIPKEVNAILVGTALMKARSIAGKLKELKDIPLIKVCGITNKEDAFKAVEYGADFLGFNFYSGSPRYIAPKLAKEIIAELPLSVQTVGVFVNERIEKVKEIQEGTGIDFMQFHGNESFEYCVFFGLENVIKAFRVKGSESLKEIKAFKGIKFALLDSFNEGIYGGSGKQIAISKEQLKDFVNSFNGNIFIAGGLGIENIENAMHSVRPFAVDVCSSVEAISGRKDSDKMKKFFEKVNDFEKEVLE